MMLIISPLRTLKLICLSARVADSPLPNVLLICLASIKGAPSVECVRAARLDSSILPFSLLFK
jgi:hypothetical protein